MTRARRAGWVLATVWTLGLGLCLWWCLLPATRAAHATLVMACLAVSAGILVLQWRRLPRGDLYWDGAVWHCLAEGAEHAVEPQLRLDLGSAMLVRLKGWPGAAPWGYLERHAAPDAWSALRRAVHAGRMAP